jgi:anti-sigma regulatory factor (Ser/Thr protein kinase)
MADDWPLVSFLELGALPGAVPCARLHAKHVLWEWGLSELSDSAELLVSELVTNSIHASKALPWAPVVRLWLLAGKPTVRIAVGDANPKPPRPLHADAETEGGRGLLLVEAISQRWDWFRPAGMDGKVVWCEISLESQTGFSHPYPRRT